MKVKHTFDKSERLCSTKIITALFEKGSTFHSSVFKVVWTESPVKLPYPAQVVFSISKRNMRLAVGRNLARRRMREAYRKNKHILYDHLSAADRQIVIAIILRTNPVPNYDVIERAMKGVISRLISLSTDTGGKC